MSVAARRHLAWLALIAIPSVVWLFPALRDPAHTIIGPETDNLYYVRQFWWMKHALLELHRTPFFDPGSYFPVGYDVSNGELTPANTLPALPVTALAGPFVAYNLMVLASFVLTGWATYGWAYRLTGSRAGAVVAALIAELAPYRMVHATAHLPMIATQGFPLTLWACEEYLRRPSLRASAAVAGAVAVVALASWYYAYSLALMLPIYVLIRARSFPDAFAVTRRWREWLLALIVVSALVLPFALPYARASRGGVLRRSFEEMDSWSLSPYDFVIPNVNQPLWHDAMSRRFPQEAEQSLERTVSLGYCALTLGVLGLIRARRSDRSVAYALAAVALASALIALGPTLRWGGEHVMVPVPGAVANGIATVFGHLKPHSLLLAQLRAAHAVIVPLPSLWLYRYLPGASSMRVMVRFAYWTALMMAALAAFGVRGIMERLSQRKGLSLLVVTLFAAGVVFESWSLRTTTTWPPRDVDLWIAQQPPPDVVVEVPLADALRPAQDYFVTVHQHPEILGPIGTSFMVPALGERVQAISEFPSAPSIDAFRRWGATLIVVHTGMPKWALAERSLAVAGATQAAVFGETRVYRLP
jgi:hypothetical protein